MKVFVDANVFLRYFLGDDQRQAAHAEALVQDAAAGRLALLSSPPVLFEVAWVLRRGYKLRRDEVLAALESILALPGLSFEQNDRVLRALVLARDHRMEFADAYIAASALAQRCSLATFNERDFKDAGVALKAWTARNV